MQYDDGLPNEEKNSSSNMLCFTTNNREYFTGEIITGRIYLNLGQALTFSNLTISLLLTEQWQTDNNPDFKNTTICSQNVDTNLPCKPNECFILQEGTHTYPYQFDLPLNIQPSFEYPDKQSPCFHRYTLIVKIDSQSTPYQAERILLIKTKPQQQDNASLFSTSQIPNVKSFGILPRGPCTLTITYDNAYCKYSTSVPVKFDINSTQCSLRTEVLRVKVVRKVSCGKEGSEKVKEEIVYEVAIPVAVKLETKRIAHSALLREEKLEKFAFEELKTKYPTVKEWLMLMPTCIGSNVKCEYYIRGTIYFDKFVKFAERPRATLPVYIVHVSCGEMEFQEQKERERNVLEGGMLYEDNAGMYRGNGGGGMEYNSQMMRGSGFHRIMTYK